MAEFGYPETAQKSIKPVTPSLQGSIDRNKSLPNPVKIIQDFLMIPGIAGIALIDGSMIPRLYAADPQLQIHQPKAFLANVMPILRTLASEVQQLEFFFGTYHLYVTRMGYGFTVAVLTDHTIAWPNPDTDLKRFCETVQAHLKLSIPVLETWASAREGQVVTFPLAQPLPELQAYLNAFNHLAQIAAKTLGTTIVASQLNRSRPLGLDLTIEISKNQLTASPSNLKARLTLDELRLLKQWTRKFRNQCSKIILDFDNTAAQAGLTSEEIILLQEESP